MAGLAERDLLFGVPGGAAALPGVLNSALDLDDSLSGLDSFLQHSFNADGAGDLLLSAEEDHMLRTLGHGGASEQDALLYDDKRAAQAGRRTLLTRVAFSTGDLESLSFAHGAPGQGMPGAYGVERKPAFRGGAPFQRLDPALMFDGGGAFSVAECDEDDAVYELQAAAAGGAQAAFAPQRPGVPTQRSAPTRQRTPTTRHAPPPGAPAVGGPRRITPPGVTSTFVAQGAAKPSSTALMPPPPPRASLRPAPLAGTPLALQGMPSAEAALAQARAGEPQTRAASGRRAAASVSVGVRQLGMRRVQSTGDLHAYNLHSGLRSPLHAVMEGGRLLLEGTQDDGVYRIGKYTLEERRMRILRYRQKRHERNFERKIKYSCRKVLADSRPRVRGRFAKNEESAGDGTGAAAPNFDPDDFDFMDDGLIEDEHSGDAPPASFEHNSGASTSGRSAGEERQSALASVFAV